MFMVTRLCIEAEGTLRRALAAATSRFQSCLCLSLLANQVNDFSKIFKQEKSRRDDNSYLAGLLEEATRFVMCVSHRRHTASVSW